jgi:ABC-type sugar transport system ATPase subunit
MAHTILEMRNITKLFPGVRALDDVSLKVEEGEIHALVGENGAGKSTLMNVLSGIYPYGTYEGDIIFMGKECRFKTVKDSEKVGIVIIHQELALSPFMTIAENIFLGNERSKNGVINWDETNKEAIGLMKKVGLNEKYSTQIKNIGVGKQQLVEIAKALSKNCELLILDEPTAALNDEDSNQLLELLKTLNKEHGLTCIMISHKLHEVIKIANSITVLRDGKTIETLDNTETVSEGRIIKGMVGRELTDRFPKHSAKIGEIGFEIKDWVRNFSVKVLMAAAVITMLISFFTPLSAAVYSIPSAVIGGISIFLFGVIAAQGIAIMIDKKVDMFDAKNLAIIATILIIGIGGNYQFVNGMIPIFGINLPAIATAAIVGILLNALFILFGCLGKSPKRQ